MPLPLLSASKPSSPIWTGPMATSDSQFNILQEEAKAQVTQGDRILHRQSYF